MVELERIDFLAKGGPEIHVKGVDLLDGTPILDIKPYIPYADSVPTANSGWANEEITKTRVEFETLATTKILEAEKNGCTDLMKLVEQLLTIDPRPGFQRKDLPPEADHSQGKDFGLLVKDYDIKWKIQDQKFIVYDVEKIGPKKIPKKKDN